MDHDARVDKGVEEPPEEGRAARLSRRGALLGGIALGAAAGMRPAAAQTKSSEPPSPIPLIPGMRSRALAPTELVRGGTGPALAVRQVTGEPSNEQFVSGELAAGVAALGERFGMLGSTLAPREVSISQLGAGVGVGVAGLGQSFGMLGSTLAPRELSISQLGAGVGVSGVSHGVGVWGVLGSRSRPPSPAGVVGSAAGEGTGVVAESEAGFAFQSLGRVSFSSAGTGVVRAHQRVGTVRDRAISTDSLANVTLLDDPGTNATVQFVRLSGGQMDVHLTVPARREVQFAYFVYHGA